MYMSSAEQKGPGISVVCLHILRMMLEGGGVPASSLHISSYFPHILAGSCRR